MFNDNRYQPFLKVGQVTLIERNRQHEKVGESLSLVVNILYLNFLMLTRNLMS